MDGSSIVEESYKGFNLHWDKTVETDVADRLYAFTSDESVVTVTKNGDNFVITPTGIRYCCDRGQQQYDCWPR